MTKFSASQLLAESVAAMTAVNLGIAVVVGTSASAVLFILHI